MICAWKAHLRILQQGVDGDYCWGLAGIKRFLNLSYDLLFMEVLQR